MARYGGGSWKLPLGDLKSKPLATGPEPGPNHESLARGVLRTEAPGIMTIRLISDAGSLQELGEGLTGESRVAVDLEAAGFHRYSDRVCLLQVSTGDQNFVVDTLAVDPSDVLRGPLESPAGDDPPTRRRLRSSAPGPGLGSTPREAVRYADRGSASGRALPRARARS